MGSYFKMGEVWRRNKGNGTRFFTCNLKKLMQEKGLRPKDLHAVFPTVSSTQISRWIYGDDMPPDDVQCIIAMWLGISRDDIWVFQKELFEDILRIAKLQKELAQAEQALSAKISDTNTDKDDNKTVFISESVYE